MTIQEAIVGVRNFEIVCRGNRSKTQDLLDLLARCEALEARGTIEVRQVADHSGELNAIKEELYGITSENVKYRNAVDALTSLNGDLKRYVVKLIVALSKFKRAVSVSPSVFRDYEVDPEKVLGAFRALPDMAAVSPQLREFLSNGIKELENGESSVKKADSETVHIS